MASIKENLIAAKALIDTPEKWVKGKWANNEETCFCAWGALVELDVGNLGQCFDALGSAVPASFACRHADGAGRIISYNDDPATTHADIMALFQRAIAAQGDVA